MKPDLWRRELYRFFRLTSENHFTKYMYVQYYVGDTTKTLRSTDTLIHTTQQEQQ